MSTRDIEYRDEKLVELQLIAEARGGECQDAEYVSDGMKMRWRCSQGHEWCATPLNVRDNRTWCPACAINERKRDGGG